MRMKPSLTAADASTIVNAARAEAEANGWAVSIAVVGEGGVLWRLDRGDGAVPISATLAIGKAATSASIGMSTKALQDAAVDMPGALSVNGWVLLQGGVPIIIDGECIGGIGVSGVDSADDERAALAGLQALG